jgi:hypothetical protein
MIVMYILCTAHRMLARRTRLTAAVIAAASLSLAGFAIPSLASTYGPFNLRAVHSNRCMDVRGGIGATGVGTVVQQWACLGPAQTNQLWIAHTQHDYANMLRLRDQPGDRDKALELLGQALGTTQQLGLKALAGKAQPLKQATEPGPPAAQLQARADAR